MYSRLAQLLVLAVSVLCMAQATWFSSPKINHRAALAQRADEVAHLPALVSESSVPSPSSDASPTSVPATSPPSTSVKSTDTPSSPTTSQNSPTSSATPTPTSTNSPGASSTPSSPTTTAGSSSGNDDGSSSQTSATPVVSTETRVITMTNSDGSMTIQTTTTMTTSTAALNAGDSSNTSGMTTKTRNTIVGVVVGVGGAFVLGALGLVAFRIWGRKRHAEENDGLMDYDADLNAAEKSERGGSAGGQRNPFQSTLENYHQPTPVNASSNF